MRPTPLIVVLVAVIGTFGLGTASADPAPFGSPQDRSVEPVVLRGAQFPTWSAGPDPTFREPSTPHGYDVGDIEQYLPEQLQSDCYRKGEAYPNPYDEDDNGDHSCYQSSRLPRNPIEGAPVERLLGYAWVDGEWAQIPFQVDERFTRYISNNVSGFAFYSGTDAHNTYAFDREGFRYHWDASRTEDGNPCFARPHPDATMVNGYATTPDPVVGLDDDDELVFMWSDAGPQAPAGTALPDGIDGAFEIAVADSLDPANTAFAYVMLAADDGPEPAFDHTNGYVRYERDANADLFVYSQSSYSNYGNAPKGPHCTEDGTLVTDEDGDPVIAQRRPLDRASVRSDRYAFRYEGRWLMTDLRISPDDTGLSTGNYGPDIIDQWKARAFQQRPGGETPCCGFEEEVNNWGGSSILMGERWGPVRTIRVTWGADSATNNIRTETFTRDEIRFGGNLRVHVIPPFDGIYVQWDYNAGKVSTYYNPWQPDGVAIDGQDDEVVGNSYFYIAEDEVYARDGELEAGTPLPYGESGRCDFGSGVPEEVPEVVRDELPDDGICNDVDSPDPTFSGPWSGFNWEQIAGPNGSIVTRWTIEEHTAGDAYQLIALPYYRDDSCFDDGTGSDPGPHLRGRAVDEGPARADRGETFEGDSATYLDPVSGDYVPRECWTPEHGNPAQDPAGARRFWQGSIATHGIHLQLIADSDNANLTTPVDEIVSEQRMVVLPGDPGNVGEIYGRGTAEFPLVAVTRAL